MGIFDGIEEASSNQGGKWVEPGTHLFKICACKEPDNLYNGACFIAELEVVESNYEGYTPGDSVSWIRNVTKHGKMALGDIKAFVATAAGIEEERVTQPICAEVVGTTQPFAGMLIRCEAFKKKNKDNDGSFTRTLWSKPEA